MIKQNKKVETKEVPFVIAEMLEDKNIDQGFREMIARSLGIDFDDKQDLNRFDDVDLANRCQDEEEAEQLEEQRKMDEGDNL